MNKKIKVEICCGSAEDAIEAWMGGADRVELCSSLFLGGLSPSLGSLLEVKAKSDIEVAVMLRPREGGFCYSESDFSVLMRDAELMMSHGADALVVGLLTSDGTVDKTRLKTLMSLTGDLPVCFHRAIDVVPDWRAALDVLMDLGVKRVLSSGQAVSAFEGRDTLREMIEYCGERVVVMPGAGIRKENVAEILTVTGASEIHLGGVSRVMPDSSTQHNLNLRFGNPNSPPENSYKRVDRALVKAFINSLP